MKKSKFDTLSPELQQAYLERGGTIEPDNPAGSWNSINWSHKQTYGKRGESWGRSKRKKHKRWKNKLKK